MKLPRPLYPIAFPSARKLVFSFACVLHLLSTNHAAGQQQPPNAAAGPPPLGELQRERYVEAFKDLRAQETQTIEQYDEKGVKKRRELVSDLFIYRSGLDQGVAVEYRLGPPRRLHGGCASANANAAGAPAEASPSTLR